MKAPKLELPNVERATVSGEKIAAVSLAGLKGERDLEFHTGNSVYIVNNNEQDVAVPEGYKLVHHSTRASKFEK
eukprot:2157037-Prorocentrum_lima.AAC.1